MKSILLGICIITIILVIGAIYSTMILIWRNTMLKRNKKWAKDCEKFNKVN